MKNILLVLGSARRGRVADAIASHVQSIVNTRDDISLTIADLDALALPFFNNERTPSDPEYEITDPHVAKWSSLVEESDDVLFAMPEYNHTLSGIMKNAIDSLYKEWSDKPTGVIAYGWYGGRHSLVTLREIATVVKFDLKEPAQFYFTKDIAADGSIIEDSEAKKKITAVLDQLI
jgi:NAD(P)H-dependent FMN reductase